MWIKYTKDWPYMLKTCLRQRLVQLYRIDEDNLVKSEIAFKSGQHMYWDYFSWEKKKRVFLLRIRLKGDCQKFMS